MLSFSRLLDLSRVITRSAGTGGESIPLNHSEDATAISETATGSAAAVQETRDTVQSSGKITVFDLELDVGIIEGEYRFRISKFPDLSLSVGDIVTFTASSSKTNKSSYGWEVQHVSLKQKATSQPKSIRELSSPSKKNNDPPILPQPNDVPGNQRESEVIDVRIRDFSHYRTGPTTVRQKQVLCKVAHKPKDRDFFTIFFPSSSNLDQFEISKKKFGPAEFLLVGDWLKLHLEQRESSDDCEAFSFAEWSITRIEWAEQGITLGEIEVRGGLFHVENIFCPEREFNKKGQNLKVGDFCKVKYVLSDQYKTQPEDGEVTYFPKRSCVIETATAAEVEEWEEGQTLSAVTAALEGLYRNKNSVVIKPPLIRFGTFKIGSCIRKSIEITNQGRDPVALRRIKLQCDQSVCDFTFEISNPEGGGILKTIDGGGVVSINLVCVPRLIGKTSEICCFDFGSFTIGRKITVHALPEDVEKLEDMKDIVGRSKSKQGQRRQDEERRLKRLLLENRAQIVKGPVTIRAPFFIPCTSPDYRVPADLEETYIAEQSAQGKGSVLLRKNYPDVDWNVLNFKNYLKRFHVSLWLEELEISKLRKDLDLSEVLLRSEEDYLYVTVPYLSESKPVLQVGERVRCYYTEDAEKMGWDQQKSKFTPDSDSEDEDGNTKDAPKSKFLIHEGCIHKIVNQEVYFKFTKFHESYDPSRRVNVTFKQRRTNFKLQHHSIELAVQHLGEQWLFPEEDAMDVKAPRIQFIEETLPTSEPSPSHGPTMLTAERNRQFKTLPYKSVVDIRAPSMFKASSKLPAGALAKTMTLNWFNKGLNPEQKDAVRRILRGQCRPLPYVIFGPPGTGKTVTLVEAVMQVNRLDPNSRILVCVPSNQAGDLIAERLVRSQVYIPGDFVRLNGFLRMGQQVPESIADYCADGENLNAVLRHRIVVSTMATAGQFFKLRITPDHFTHVFIDEASYATEPEALVACVLSAVGKDGQIVLAGDPNQLLPVLHHRSEVHKILRRSLLERLMSTSLYRQYAEKYAEKFNPIFITMLTRSYRLPKVLLDLPSARFYNNNLISMAPLDSELLEKLDFLPNKRMPLIFHGLMGRCQHGGSPSWYNIDEVFQCRYYVELLRKSGIAYEDIGIISLYRRQVDVIKSYLEERIGKTEELPKVATIQEFQGGERKVIIISTVISTSQEYLEKVSPNAFILSSKMFNVCITRAKSLLIVIGDPSSLQFSPDWMALIKYCIQLGVYYGCQLPAALSAPAILSYVSNEADSSSLSEFTQEDESVGGKAGETTSDRDNLGGNSGGNDHDDSQDFDFFDEEAGFDQESFTSHFA